MFIVILKLVDGNRIGENLEGHNAWLKQGFDDGVFVLAGTIEPKRGGALLVTNTTRAALQARIEVDPFVSAGIAAPEILEITPARTDTRLDFLKPS